MLEDSGFIVVVCELSWGLVVVMDVEMDVEMCVVCR